MPVVFLPSLLGNTQESETSPGSAFVLALAVVVLLHWTSCPQAGPGAQLPVHSHPDKENHRLMVILLGITPMKSDICYSRSRNSLTG